MITRNRSFGVALEAERLRPPKIATPNVEQNKERFCVLRDLCSNDERDGEKRERRREIERADGNCPKMPRKIKGELFTFRLFLFLWRFNSIASLVRIGMPRPNVQRRHVTLREH